MKLLDHTYQVSYHNPVLSPIMDRVDNTEAYPKHLRVRAKTATEAIQIALDHITAGHNYHLIDEEQRAAESGHPTPGLAPNMVEFFKDRDENRFIDRDFPIMEVKVVA